MTARNIKRRRNTLRLKDFDYSSEGYYFVTISCKERKKCFENENGRTIIKRQVDDIEKRFDILIDCFVVMSDHIHMIIVFNEAKKVNLSKVIQALKSLVAKEFKEKLSVRDKFWQRGFYDHISETKRITWKRNSIF